MILSKTPLRVSFVGGSTDLPSFYEKHEYGCVISTAIKQYVYIGVNHRFDGKIRLAYSKNEVIDSIHEIENERMRSCLESLDILDSIEIFYISDVPKQMGLGGSSSFVVGLLNALYQYKGITAFPERLAREACKIEIDILKNPIGKQDQFAAAIGGFNYIRFNYNGTVTVQPILIEEESLIALMDNLVFLYLNISHDASNILNDVSNNSNKNYEYMLAMRNLTDNLFSELMKNNIHAFKDALKENWELKKKTSKYIQSSVISEVYDIAIKNGAEAGKILGAGGGGVMMLFVPIEKQKSFYEKMKNFKIMKFEIDHYGSQIIHSSNNKGQEINLL